MSQEVQETPVTDPVTTTSGTGSNGRPPDADFAVAFDADARAKDRAKKGYRVAGIVYYPKKKTGRLVKEILELQGDTTTPDTEEAEQRLTLAERLENIDNLYRQVAMLLADENGESPDPERLQDVLDFQDARDMIAPLMGNQSPEDAAAGKPVGGDDSPPS